MRRDSGEKIFTPLDSLDGKSPFQVTQDGFACHKSQHWTWFYKWIYGTKDRPITRAADIRSYSPCLYGLYYTAVGPDEVGGDLFEHVETYAARRSRLEEAQAAREAAEEEARRQAEEAAKAEAEAQARARAEEEAQAVQQKQARQRGLFRITAVSVGAAVLAVVLLLVLKRHR